MSLGPAIKPDPAPPEPEWKRIKGTPFEINAKGQKRTWIPANEAANGYGWPNVPVPSTPEETP